MNAFLAIIRVALSGVLIFAGLTKLRDRAGTQRAAVNLGAPMMLGEPIARFLPFVEILLALALLPVATAAIAAWITCGLLVAFTVAMAVLLLRGKSAECNCFGTTGAGPLGWPSVARSALLASAAGFVAWPKADGAGASLVAWVAGS